ncbi:MAG: hypothetical protein RL095_4175 [Verrucomicrobiota bacterium]|jgi:RNA polymerase sigma factor (sigma-70 family)
MSQSTRVTLLQRLRLQQDDASWADFCRYYQPFIRAVLMQLGSSSDEVEDLGQEVLLRSWKSLPTFEYREGQCRFRTWLGQICRHCLVDARRREQAQRRRLTPDFAPPLSSDAEIEALAEDEWQSYISDLAWSNIQERFTEAARQSFLLGTEGLTSVEIAARLGIPDSSVRVNKQRITSALYKEIVRLDNDLGR